MTTYVYIITLKCLEAFSTVLYLCFTYCWFSLLSTCSSFGCSIQRATCQSFLYNHVLFDSVSICDEEFPLERANIINPVHLKKSTVVYVFTRSCFSVLLDSCIYFSRGKRVFNAGCFSYLPIII